MRNKNKMNIENFIKENTNDINNNNWGQIYKNLLSDCVNSDSSLTIIGKFTEMLLSCGINPLLYMNYIPQFFLNGSTKTYNFEIPNNIKEIRQNAFSHSNILHINIPSSITQINDLAFIASNSIEEINIQDAGAFNEISFLGISSDPTDFCGRKFLLNKIPFEELNLIFDRRCEFNPIIGENITRVRIIKNTPTIFAPHNNKYGISARFNF